MISQSTILKVAVFVPELAPLAAQIVKAVNTAEVVETLLKPAIDRLAKNEPAFIEMTQAVPGLIACVPDMAQAFQTLMALQDVIKKYESKLAGLQPSNIAGE